MPLRSAKSRAGCRGVSNQDGIPQGCVEIVREPRSTVGRRCIKYETHLSAIRTRIWTILKGPRSCSSWSSKRTKYYRIHRSAPGMTGTGSRSSRAAVPSTKTMRYASSSISQPLAIRASGTTPRASTRSSGTCSSSWPPKRLSISSRRPSSRPSPSSATRPVITRTLCNPSTRIGR